MMTIFLILILLAAASLGFFILVQNPKGGGLAGNIAGFNTQFMGVKQTTDILEKGTSSNNTESVTLSFGTEQSYVVKKIVDDSSLSTQVRWNTNTICIKFSRYISEIGICYIRYHLCVHLCRWS